MPSTVEHIFARQKEAMGLFVRTIGIARARTNNNGLADAPNGSAGPSEPPQTTTLGITFFVSAQQSMMVSIFYAE
jgi:hypothetical protein